MLESALETFAHTGYRGTSMEAIARAAEISRPGLYFLFESKEALFREAASHVVSTDLERVRTILADEDTSQEDRLVAAFDQWAGRYIGPLARDVPSVIAANPRLLDDSTRGAPAEFVGMLTAMLPEAVATTLHSVSVGLVHQVVTRAEYVDRIRVAVRLLTAPTESISRCQLSARGSTR